MNKTHATTYTELKKIHSEEFGAFEGVFFAFNDQQFNEGMEKVGLTAADTGSIYKMGSGGYILKSRNGAFKIMFAKQAEEMKAFKADQKNLLAALIYELQNHEYCITGDPTDALETLGLTAEEVDPKILAKACKIAGQDGA